MDYRKQATVGLLGGIAHLITILITTLLYASVSGVDYSFSAFINGGVPILVLTILGATGVLLYYNYEVLTPLALIITFDLVAIVSSPPIVWTEPGPAGPPSFYELYIFFFLVPLCIAVLMGSIEYYARKGSKSQTILPGF